MSPLADMPDQELLLPEPSPQRALVADVIAPFVLDAHAAGTNDVSHANIVPVDRAAAALAAEPARRAGLAPLAKRIVARLIRFHTVRQAALDAELAARDEKLAARDEELAARVLALERAFGELAQLRRDLHDVAVDFGAIADRFSSLDNVRRIVNRSAPFRDEVRAQRNQLAELRRQLASMSARLTFVQRAGGPARTRLDALEDDVAALHEQLARER